MVKVIFGLLGLLVVLAIVSSLAKTQLGAMGGSGPTTAHRSDAGAAVPPASQPIQGLPQSVRDRTADALQEGVQSRQRASP